MDPSALIFVALAVAWAVYLIPKALEHHDASDRTRTIDRFSHGLRVLGRREPVDRRSARLVRTGTATKAAPRPAAAAPQAPGRPVARPRTASAARRRRNVLAVIVLVLVATVACAALGVVAKVWVAAPVVVLVAWLVACRLMVRGERAVPVRRAPAPVGQYAAPAAESTDDETREVPVVADEADDAATADSAVGRWDPVDVPLPTYVSKPAAARTVRTIDLDATGVWSSGRNEADSALAREADAARSNGAESTRPVRRRTGS